MTDTHMLEGNVYNDECAVVDGLTTNLNPCTVGTFGCSPPPIIFNEYTNTFSGMRSVYHCQSSVMVFTGHCSTRYACRTDPNSGECNGDLISVCVRNAAYIVIDASLICLSVSAATTVTRDRGSRIKYLSRCQLSWILIRSRETARA